MTKLSFLVVPLILNIFLVVSAQAQLEELAEESFIEDNALDLFGASSPWKIMRPEWTGQDEENFSRFVTHIGDSISKGLCATVSDCFKNPQVNPYASTDPQGLRLFADCADFPYFVRGYFAWRNQLPFGYVSSLEPIQNPTGEPTKDIRYSQFGNVVKGRHSVVPKKPRLGRPRYPNAIEIFNDSLPGRISSGTFRVSYSGMDADGLYSDFYPVRVTRDAIRPGTVLYDPNGHIAIIYKITKDGRVYYIDAHPDNSLTTGLYNSRFMRSYPGHGAGFKNWRPLRLVDATWGGDDSGYYGGRLIGAKDAQLPMYSTEQYYGTSANPDWRQAQFQFQGQTLDYYVWVRNRLADGPLVENPIDDVKIMAMEICKSVQERSVAVQVAVDAGIHLQEHPFRLPNNIYGASGDWETYATPARDARLKMAFKELRDYVEEALQHHRAHDGKVDYRGANLAADMLAAYQQTSSSCRISYKNSGGQSVSMNLEQARARIYDVSFDPYHCPELRWGAKGNELNTCADDATKRAWYDREKWLRFQHERDTNAYHGYTLDELTGPRPGAGVPAGQDLDIVAFLTKNK
ncbi:hypothetical protein [Bdellovibrio sp. HCB337]|uniref:hypothetical protein n=1 Tax=Bdellovibrio sp. HCB337 TaxID=3394358 RepID=UPI0039A4D755